VTGAGIQSRRDDPRHASTGVLGSREGRWPSPIRTVPSAPDSHRIHHSAVRGGGLRAPAGAVTAGRELTVFPSPSHPAPKVTRVGFMIIVACVDEDGQRTESDAY